MLTRRASLFGFLAAPAIIRTPGLLMAVRPTKPTLYPMMSFDEIYEEIKRSARLAFGEGADLSPSTPIGSHALSMARIALSAPCITFDHNEATLKFLS